MVVCQVNGGVRLFHPGTFSGPNGLVRPRDADVGRAIKGPTDMAINYRYETTGLAVKDVRVDELQSDQFFEITRFDLHSINPDLRHETQS